MKNITIYYFCTIAFLFIMACESPKQVTLKELAYQTHFRSDISDALGVYLVGENSTEASPNLKYENKDGVYSLLASSRMCHDKLNGNKISVYAYAPYREDALSELENHHIEVYSDQRDSLNYRKSDFQYARLENSDLSADIIDLAFNNKLARLTININKSDLSKSDKISFEITNVATSMSINLRTGELFEPKNIGSIKPFRQEKANAGFDYTLDAILVPQKILRDTPVFKFRIDGRDYSYRTRYGSSLKSSMHYICNIMIDNGVLSVESEEFPRIKGSALDNISVVSERVYKIGDYYPIADDPLSAIGVVFSTVDNGAHGKILSLNEAVGLEWGPLLSTGAKSKISGASNKAIIEQKANFIGQYQALSWCLDKGKDWYLPAINELAAICIQKEVLNIALSPLLRSNNLGNGVYVSSTEDSDSKVLVLHFGNGQRFLQDKNFDFYVRAVSDF